jgi:hypothetical protein
MIAQKMKQIISAYIDGELSADEAKKVASLIDSDPAYKQYADELKKISSSLQTWNDEPLSPDLERKIAAALAQRSPVNSAGSLASRSPVNGNLREDLRDNKGENPMKSKGSGLRIAASIAVFFLVLTVSMKVYVKRGIQGRWKAAGNEMGDQFDPRQFSAPLKFKGQAASGANAAYRKRATSYDAKMITQAARRYEPYYLDTDYNVVPSEEKDQAFPTLPTPASGLLSVRYQQNGPFQTGEYGHSVENVFKEAKQEPLSTFSIDVDTASYSNIRRVLDGGQMPPVDSVRIEEMINYFGYDYPAPAGEDPFSITTQAATAPWNKNHKIVLIGLKGKTLPADQIPPSNLVFLIDVSGSMSDVNKLPLVQKTLSAMVNQLTDKEKVAIVVYAGAAGKVLDSTPGSNKPAILSAINNLHAGGSTAGAESIESAYQIAKENFIRGGNNRIILVTDGDFNVGVSDTGSLVRMIEEKRKEGIFLTIAGFGMGNYKDSRMEQLADNGNGDRKSVV